MSRSTLHSNKSDVSTFEHFAELADYSLMENLTPDPSATVDGYDHQPRQVFSGHYVPVAPTPIGASEYVAYSRRFFEELGLDNALLEDERFCAWFSGDTSVALPPLRPFGWATGYALSIYGTEYIQQCPFRTGNGYGDGRAISVFEGVIKGKRWEMQLKGAGPTPYCRGADGRAVLRSSVREFLAQEFMHALGVPTSRSLTLFVSNSETVTRPWYSGLADTVDPDVLVENPVAISTRVAPSFLRVGQIELFARRARGDGYGDVADDVRQDELKQLLQHVIAREYSNEIDPCLPFSERLITLAQCFAERLTELVANWLRVGYCQGNFNSDNCALGGFTLDYGPFGFCEIFDPEFQPWTGGGQHFSFFNQPAAAEANFHMFYLALSVALGENPEAQQQLESVRKNFSHLLQRKAQNMWAKKLGLHTFDIKLFKELLQLMQRAEVDYTIFFRELSSLPKDVAALKKSFYVETSADIDVQFQDWLTRWREQVVSETEGAEAVKNMRSVNPKYTWREWLIVPAYQQAAKGNFELIHELQKVLSQPYAEQSPEIEEKYYRLKPKEFYSAGGVSHYSCSS